MSNLAALNSIIEQHMSGVTALVTPNEMGAELVSRATYVIEHQREVSRGIAHAGVLTLDGVQIRIENNGEGGASFYTSPQGPEAIARTLEAVRDGFGGEELGEELLGLFADITELVAEGR